MIKYLVILLDDTSTSYCHYENRRTERLIIDINTLNSAILFAMKENLMVQFVYPEYELPKAYKDIIHSIDHVNIVSSLCEDTSLPDSTNVVIFDNWTGVDVYDFQKDGVYVIRTSKNDLFDHYLFLRHPLANAARVNVVITDIETFDEKDFSTYKKILEILSEKVEMLYVKGESPQLNLLTDRFMLDNMNNCNAGWESVTLAPDGNFYVCPAFYLSKEDEDYGLGKSEFSIGNLEKGLDIKNPQLYKLSHAPLCRKCDAYHCKRCVWLNRKTTFEINTPSHEQCVVAHLERNASCGLLTNIRKHGTFMPGTKIKEIDYLDPFDVKEEN